MNSVQRITIALSLSFFSVLGSGCGEHGTNIPATKLTASVIASQADASTHTHSVTIPFTDVSATPLSDVYQYRSDIANGHSHVIALSKQQVMDVNNGLRLVLTSSVPNAGTSHTHTWNIQGGDILYDKNCYNCHSNDNRGRSPMNVSFNSSQTSAVISPSGAPLSTVQAAMPDPAYSQSTAINLDGPALYAANCASCHNLLANSSKQNRTYAQIKAAIGAIGQMNSLGALSDAQLQAIATALVK